METHFGQNASESKSAHALSGKSKKECENDSKFGALETISKISAATNYKAKAKAFRSLLEVMYKKKIDHDYDSDLEESLELPNKKNNLLEEILMAIQIEDKDNILKSSPLTIRIKYRVLQKFLIILYNVEESVEYRHLNDAFDALIDAANDHYERQMGLFYKKG